AALRVTKKALGLVARLSPKMIRKKIECSGMRAVWVIVRSRPIVLAALGKLVRFVATSRHSQDKFRLSMRDEYRRVSNYIPKKLDTELFCLVCDESATRMDFRPSNWRRVARSVHTKVVPGDHYSCVKTFAGVVATELQRIVSS